MLLKKPVEILIVALFFIFSCWLMGKSFGYETGEFRIARHQVGDFGLHLSLIRSFSWGTNWPVESPFYPDKLLPYHYGVDLTIGLLERVGVRIDYAVNGVSAVSFTFLLYLIYRLTHTIFGYNPFRGLLAVMFFIFSSNLSFIDFIKTKSNVSSLLTQAWTMPDYIHKGPFDGSVISIFSSLNPLLNQRHLIVGLVISLCTISYLIKRLIHGKHISLLSYIVLGGFIGISTRIHSLIAASAVVVIVVLLFLFQRAKFILPFAVSVLLFAIEHLSTLFIGGGSAITFHPGFLSLEPVTLAGWLSYWWQNIGLVYVFLPIGLVFSAAKQRKVFLSFFVLFVIANVFQLSYRMEHNYSVVTLCMIVVNMFVAHAIIILWKKTIGGKLVATMAIFFLTASGILNLAVVKNDYQHRVPDEPKNKFMTWIKSSTAGDAIFLARQDLYDPVTLSGRKNYFGASYYLDVMGYDTTIRRSRVKQFFEAHDLALVEGMRSEGIDYVILPNQPVDNFPYSVDRLFFDSYATPVYQDIEVTVYKL